jgi:hypothetical protein
MIHVVIAAGAALVNAIRKGKDKEDFVAVKGRKHKDGTVGKASIRRRRKSR